MRRNVNRKVITTEKCKCDNATITQCLIHSLCPSAIILQLNIIFLYMELNHAMYECCTNANHSMYECNQSTCMNAMIIYTNADIQCMNAVIVCMNAKIPCLNAVILCLNVVISCMNAAILCLNAVILFQCSHTAASVPLKNLMMSVKSMLLSMMISL